MEKKIERAARHCGVSELSKSSINATNEKIVTKRLAHFFRTSLALSKFSTAFAMSWVKEHAADESCQRVMAYLLARMNDRRAKCKTLEMRFYISQRKSMLDITTSLTRALKRGCPQIICLRASNFWDPDQFEWIKKLRCAFPKIREEVLALRSSSMQKETGFQPYRAPSSTKKDKQGSGTTRGTAAHDSGEWNIYYLYLHNIDFSANRERVPETVKLLKSIPRFYDHAMFSNLASTTHVTKHHGPTNKKLRIHLPLYVPEEKNSCRLRVGDETRASIEGCRCVWWQFRAWSVEWPKSRVVLIFDIWHPDLSDQEVKFLSFIQEQLRANVSVLNIFWRGSWVEFVFNHRKQCSVRPSEKILWKM